MVEVPLKPERCLFLFCFCFFPPKYYRLTELPVTHNCESITYRNSERSQRFFVGPVRDKQVLLVLPANPPFKTQGIRNNPLGLGF